MSKNEDKCFVNVSQLARVTGISAVTLRKRIRSGELRPSAIDLNANPLFDLDEAGSLTESILRHKPKITAS